MRCALSAWRGTSRPLAARRAAATYWPSGSSSGNGTPNSNSLAKASAKSDANFSPANGRPKRTQKCCNGLRVDSGLLKARLTQPHEYLTVLPVDLCIFAEILIPNQRLRGGKMLLTWSTGNILPCNAPVVDELTISVGSIINCLLLSSYCSGPVHFFFVLHTYTTRGLSLCLDNSGNTSENTVVI